jgi:hypothetical protein
MFHHQLRVDSEITVVISRGDNGDTHKKQT